MKIFLPKTISWITLIFLMFVDSILDVVRGAEGNPIWIPIVKIIGIDYVPFLVPFIFLFLFVAVKIVSSIVRKVDKTEFAEEIIVSALVLFYFFYDLWLISVDFLNFRFVTDFRIISIPLIIVAIIYAFVAERLSSNLKHFKKIKS